MNTLNFLSDIVTDLSATGVGVIIGLTSRGIKRYYHLRGMRKVWKNSHEGHLTIVFGDFHGTDFENQTWEASGLMGIGDTMALSEIRIGLDMMRIRDYSIYQSKNVSGEKLSQNLMLIGGPD